MQKILVTYGIIAGAIVSAMLMLSMPLHEQGILNFSNGMVVGYATMVIALSLIFFAIRSVRDTLQGGQITFWKGTQIGLTITLIASIMYCIAWEISYRSLAGDFMARMSDYYVQEKINSGASALEVEATRKEMRDFEEMYKNPVVRFGYTLLEIVPVGVIITLVCAGLLRRKQDAVTADT